MSSNELALCALTRKSPLRFARGGILLSMRVLASTAVLVVAAVAWLASARLALAEDVPLRVVVRVAHAGDIALLERVRGQTNDLEVELASDASELESSIARQLERARALSVQASARAVVWFTRKGSELTVFVAEPLAGRVVVRTLERPAEQLASSAQQEAAALVVRTAVRSIALGAPIGVEEDEVLEPAPTREVPAPQPLVVSAPPHEREREPLELASYVGVRCSYDGVSRPLATQLALRLGLRVHAFVAELRAAYGLASELDERLSRVRLARHAATLHAGYALVAKGAFLVSIAGGAGIDVLALHARARDPAFAARGHTTALPVLTADVSVRYLPALTRGRVGIAFAAGSELLPRSPTLGYDDDASGSFRTRAHVGHVLPWASLELALRLR